MDNTIKKAIIEQSKALKETGDCIGIRIANSKGLFIQVENNIDNGERIKEYFVELNDVEDDCYYPCGDYNERVKFGDIELLIEKIENYLEYHGIKI